MPDNGIEEVCWVESMIRDGRCLVAAIVAHCNLSLLNTRRCLEALQQASPDRLRGIRCILDYDGPYEESGSNGTHVFCSRHNVDYLRDPQESQNFENGFAMLSEFNLSFDLQCTPAQLPAAAALLGRHPRVRVCVNHMGKPRDLEIIVNDASDAAEQGSSYSIPEATAQKLAAWRAGMKLMADLPQVYVKLSMLGFAVPGMQLNDPLVVLALIVSLFLYVCWYDG